MIKNDITNILLLLNKVIEKGFDGQHFIDGFSSHLRDLMVSRKVPKHMFYLNKTSTLSEKYSESS